MLEGALMTTIKEIAEKSGYSSATVSRLLNHDPTFSISDAAKEHILKIANNLNYSQKNSVKGPTFNAAIIFAMTPKKEIEDAYFGNLRQSLLNHSESANVRLTFFREISELSEHFEGVLAVGNFSEADLAQINRLSDTVVFIDSNPDPQHFNSVQPNLEYITKNSIDLFRHAGFSRIGFIGGQFWDSENTQIPIDDLRKTYFESYMRALHIYDENLVFIGSNFSVESGYNLGLDIVKKMEGHPLPQGFFIGSDPLAVGVLQAFNEHRITVPIDTTIISVNDIDIAQYASPPLTTFRIDINDLAKTALDTLRDAIIAPKRNTREVLLNANVVFRKSFPKTLLLNKK